MLNPSWNRGRLWLLSHEYSGLIIHTNTFEYDLKYLTHADIHYHPSFWTRENIYVYNYNINEYNNIFVKIEILIDEDGQNSNDNIHKFIHNIHKFIPSRWRCMFCAILEANKNYFDKFRVKKKKKRYIVFSRFRSSLPNYNTFENVNIIKIQINSWKNV